MTRIEEIEAMLEAFSGWHKGSDVARVSKGASWLLEMVKRMRPLLQRGYANKVCRNLTYKKNGRPILCGRCDTCLVCAIKTELEEGVVEDMMKLAQNSNQDQTSNPSEDDHE